MVADRLAGQDEIATAPWFRDRAAWRFVTRGYLPWLAATSVVWEVGHAPLYTLWREATPAYLAFAIAHCTLGDILIGTLALLLALVVLRQPGRLQRMDERDGVPELSLFIASRIVHDRAK